MMSCYKQLVCHVPCVTTPTRITASVRCHDATGGLDKQLRAPSLSCCASCSITISFSLSSTPFHLFTSKVFALRHSLSILLSDTKPLPAAPILLQLCDLQLELAGGLGTVVSSTFIGFLILLLQCGLQ